MKVIVTGGCGFIGSHIVDRLIEDGLTVIVIDNESAECHEQFYHNPKAHNYKFDICDYENTRPLFEGVDYVFHLAAEARIQPSLINPLLTVRTNSLGTSTILQCAREAGVKRVIYSSTSSAYGRKHYQPQSLQRSSVQSTGLDYLNNYRTQGTGYWWKGLTENMEDDCLTPYSVSKVSGEKMCKMYSELFGLDTVILRYFNVYGEREPTKGQYAPVIGKFLRQFACDQPMTIIGDGEQRRDFTYIKDVVDANVLCMKCEGELNGEMFNIGTGKNYSINEIANLISYKGAVCFANGSGGDEAGNSEDRVYIPERKGESRVTLANRSKAENILGWFPKRNLEEYLRGKI
jgi:UDP-glucose 4-epimerase